MKKLVLICLVAVSCMAFVACSSTDTNGGSANNQNNNQEQNNTSNEVSYIFTYDGVDVSVNEDISAVLAKLGEPVSYYEAASCAFEGLDKIYTYASFQIDTYPSNGADMLASIYFLDDLVETPEGITLNMSKQDMIAAYGEPTSIEGTEHIYEKGNGTLRFIIVNDEIISIEYRTNVDYK